MTNVYPLILRDPGQNHAETHSVSVNLDLDLRPFRIVLIRDTRSYGGISRVCLGREAKLDGGMARC